MIKSDSETFTLTRPAARPSHDLRELAAGIRSTVGTLASFHEQAVLATAAAGTATGRELLATAKTLDGIAVQASMLAEEAALEATQAGSAGQGFARVADSIRLLAAYLAQTAEGLADKVEPALVRNAMGTQYCAVVTTGLCDLQQQSAELDAACSQPA